MDLLDDLLAYDPQADPTDLLSRAYNEIGRLRDEVEELKVRSIGERNPGIDLDEVRQHRRGR